MRGSAVLLGAVLSFPAWACAQEKDFGKRPDWSLTLPDGKKLSAADFDGKVLIVDFWATWCPPCRKEIPGFIALKKKYGEKGLEILGFSYDQERAVHDTWVKQNGVNYLSVVVQGDEIKKAVGALEEKIGPVEALPTTIVLNRAGNIVYKHVGYAPSEEFEKVIRPLLEGKKP
jgi:thiol-disulfide isomerase/thioredoxin